MTQQSFTRLSIIVLVLFGIWPFVSFLNHNQADASIIGQRILVYGLAFLVLLVLVAVIGKAALRKTPFAKIANALAAAVVVLFNYLALDELLSNFGIALGTVKIAIWLVVLAAVMVTVWRLSNWRQSSLVLAIVGCVMVAIPAVQFSWYAVGSAAAPKWGGADLSDPVPQPEADQAVATLPNVYWIILDMYTRADVLEKYFGYTNREFVQSLKDRGFFVAERALSNYPGSWLSISATVSMNYIWPLGVRVSPTMWMELFTGFNPTVDRFVDLGYRYIHTESYNSPKTRCGGREDKCIKPNLKGFFGISEAEVALLRLTPLYRIIRRLAPNLFSYDFTTIEEVMTTLDPASDSPFFVFAHILSPHPPARYEADCSPIIEDVDWVLFGGDRDESLAAYFTDLRCLNPQVVSAIDQILTNDPSDPIIIIQGDHGLRNLDGVEARPIPEIDPLLVGHAILHAMRLPERCGQNLDHEFSSINTFRVVFNCIEGGTLELLPRRLFSTRWASATDSSGIVVEEMKLNN